MKYHKLKSKNVLTHCFSRGHEENREQRAASTVLVKSFPIWHMDKQDAEGDAQICRQLFGSDTELESIKESSVRD